MFLDKFRNAKMPEVERLRELERQGRLPEPCRDRRASFIEALRNPRDGRAIAVIAEFKQASPSLGSIRQGLTPESIAGQYARGGADCLSVLTEEQYFGGDIGYPARMTAPGIPLLRKDFIFDPLQVSQTASLPVSAMLLIVRMTPDASLLRRLREQGEQSGIESVVEIFDQADLELARESGAKIIQVNARDLDTLKTDRNVCLQLAEGKQASEVWIAASGMDSAEHIRAAARAGYDAVLIGTALMQGDNPGDTLRDLLNPLNQSAR